MAIVSGIRRGKNGARRSEQGFILLMLMLWVGLMVIAATAVLPSLVLQVKRDREEEMVHRGVQYARAVRRYYRKFGGYPQSIDVLESSNNLRFLRKRYNDPITRQDFKILHLADVTMMFGSRIPGAQTIGTPAGSLNQPVSGTQGGNQAQSGNTDSAQDGTDKTKSNSPFVTASGAPAGADFGGGPLVGVASTSTAESVRIYNKKDHYNDWFFAYDPAGDRGGTITGPWQPALAIAMPGQMGLPGQTGQPGQPGFGQGMTPGTGGMQPGGGMPRPR